MEASQSIALHSLFIFSETNPLSDAQIQTISSLCHPPKNITNLILARFVVIFKEPQHVNSTHL